VYYRCPRCGVINEGPTTDIDLNELCPRCGSLVVLEDYDRPFLESRDRINDAARGVLLFCLVVGACSVLSRCTG